MPDEPKEFPDSIKIDYIKSNQFRVVHADGVWGGVTPRGLIHIDVWSERQPIPQSTVYDIRPNGTVGEEKRDERKCRDAYAVREVEVGIVFDLDLAKNFVEWMKVRIALAEATIASAPEPEK